MAAKKKSKTGKDDYKSIKTERDKLLEELAKLKDKAASVIRIKVGEKTGTVSVKVGSGRWPVSLYRDQWRILLNHAKAISEYLDEHEDVLPSRELEIEWPKDADETNDEKTAARERGLFEYQ